MTHMYHDRACRVEDTSENETVRSPDDVPTAFSCLVTRYFNGSIFSGVEINAGSGIKQLSQINGNKPSSPLPTNWPAVRYGYYYYIIITIIIVIWSVGYDETFFFPCERVNL